MTTAPVAPDDWRGSAGAELPPIAVHALDAFYEKGYHGTSVRDIAARVGVTVPALYYHYANKEAILHALLDGSIERLRELCERAVAEAGDDVELRFLNLVECTVRYMANSKKLAYLSAEYRALSPALRESYSAKRQAVEDLVHGAIRDGADVGVFDVAFPRDAARGLLGLIQAVATWFRPEGALDVDQVVARYLDLAVHMVGADAELVARVRAAAR